MLVDPAATAGIEKCARTRRMRRFVLEELRVVPLDDRRLDREDRQIVAAAIGASESTIQASRVHARDREGCLVDCGMEPLDPIDDLLRQLAAIAHAGWLSTLLA